MLLFNSFLCFSCFSDEALSADSDDESISSSSESSSSSSSASSSSSDEEDEEDGEQAAESESLDTMDESTMDSVAAIDAEKDDGYVPFWELILRRKLSSLRHWHALSVSYRDKASLDQSSATAAEVKHGQLKITFYKNKQKRRDSLPKNDFFLLTHPHVVTNLFMFCLTQHILNQTV